jgi:uncharacterized protein
VWTSAIGGGHGLSFFSLALNATNLATASMSSSSVTPHSDYEPQSYRMDDYAAYYHRIRDSLIASISSNAAGQIYPDPVEHCDLCRWQERCDRRRRQDDHLSLVAGATKVQIEELKRQGVETVSALAAMPALTQSRGSFSSVFAERLKVGKRLAAGRPELDTVGVYVCGHAVSTKRP